MSSKHGCLIPGQYDYGAEIGLSLFDLEADPGETTDVSRDYPGELARLQRIAEQFRTDLGDKLTAREGTGLREPGSRHE